jgi:hypothetical protein
MDDAAMEAYLEGETIEVPAGRVESDRLWLSEAELENALTELRRFRQERFGG